MKRKLATFLAGLGIAASILLPVISCTSNPTVKNPKGIINPNGSVRYIIPNRETLEKKILAESEKYSVVLLGDEHQYNGRDNVFAAGLLKRYKAKGFNYFLLENVSDSEKGSNKRMYADFAAGKITKEEIPEFYFDLESWRSPGWFDLIEAAKEAEMNIICYDPNKKKYSSMNEREILAFSTIKEVFEKDPNAKMVIYAGGFHINEKPAFDEESGEIVKTIAYHLDKFTNGRILTVNLATKSFDPFFSSPYCDIAIDLDDGIFYYNKNSK